MNTIGQIWNFIVTSNFFNFVVMVLILTWIINKVNLADILEKAVVSIKNTIEKAEQEKSAGEKELQTALKSVENLDNEIKERINTAEKHAEKIAQNIICMNNHVSSSNSGTNDRGKFCTSCGASVSEQAKFCQECGAKL